MPGLHQSSLPQACQSSWTAQPYLQFVQEPPPVQDQVIRSGLMNDSFSPRTERPPEFYEPIEYVTINLAVQLKQAEKLNHTQSHLAYSKTWSACSYWKPLSDSLTDPSPKPWKGQANIPDREKPQHWPQAAKAASVSLCDSKPLRSSHGSQSNSETLTAAS